MARGRMLNKSIVASPKFAALSNDTCRLLATWIIAHLDKHGVYYGSAGRVKGQIFPERDDIPATDVNRYMKEMEAVGLIEFFFAKGVLWQVWPGFADNQIGLRANREADEYPAPPQSSGTVPQSSADDDDTPPDAVETIAGSYPEVIRKLSGNHPENVPPNGMEKKGKEVAASPPRIPPTEKEKTPRPRDVFFDCLTEITHSNPAIVGSEIASAKKKLLAAGVTIGDLRCFETWWNQEDFRGKKGNPPKPHEITREWAAFQKWQAGTVTPILDATGPRYEWLPLPNGSSGIRIDGQSYVGDAAKEKCVELGIEWRAK